MVDAYSCVSEQFAGRVVFHRAIDCCRRTLLGGDSDELLVTIGRLDLFLDSGLLAMVRVAAMAVA